MSRSRHMRSFVGLYMLRGFCALLGVFGLVNSADAQSRPGSQASSSNWMHGLKLGPNGPIPPIVVDQFGYPTQATKIAVIRSPQAGYDSFVKFTPGSVYEVVDQSTGRTVLQAAPVRWNDGATDLTSGDRAWWLDFTAVTTPGTYAIRDIENGLRSPPFEIGDGVYRKVMKHAVRTYFYQRAGFGKSAGAAGRDWADAASHLGPGQDAETRPWRAKGALGWLDRSLTRDLRGGWYDAGDYNKYTSWTARNVVMLLRAFDENPGAFDDASGIPESANGVPDLLDEVKWALDWLIRMQNPDGSMLCIQGLDQASPPSAATGPSYYGPETTAATLAGASAFAFASRIYSRRSEARLREFSIDLAGRARKAWVWASAHPRVTFYNNDDTKQPGSAGLAGGQQEMDDDGRLLAKIEAAAYLYALTNTPEYKQFVEAQYASIIPSHGPSQWDADKLDLLLFYAGLPNVMPEFRSQVIDKIFAAIKSKSDQLPMVIENKDPYRAPIKDYSWGSNQSKMKQAHIYRLLSMYDSDATTAARAKSAALAYLHYIHGVNPLGLVYLTNMKVAGAQHSASTMYHHWFASSSARWSKVDANKPGPPPGYLVGGPNPTFTKDSCCDAPPGSTSYRCSSAAAFKLCANPYVPPLAQPPQKAYLQFNDGWPANSWQITEPSTGYQAWYIRALAPYVE